MRRHRYWQVASTVLLTILLVVPFSFINALAATYNANYSLTQYNYYVEKNGTNWATTDIFVNFKSPASGTLTVNINPTLSSTYYSFNVISGGNLAAAPTTSTSKLTIGVRSEKTVHIRVQSISTSSNAHATYTMSFSGTYEDGEALSLENIASSTVNIEGLLSDQGESVAQILSDINSQLSNLSIEDYSSILSTINTSIGNVTSAINTQAGNIVTAINDLPDYTTLLTTIRNYCQTIDTSLNNIESYTLGIKNVIESMQQTLVDIYNDLHAIDNTIDTITWIDQASNRGYKGYSTDGKNIQSISANTSIPANTAAYFHFSTFEYTQPTLFMFQLPFSYGSLTYRYITPNIEVYTLYNNALYPVADYELYYFGVYSRSYIFYEGFTSGSYDLVFKITPSVNGIVYNVSQNIGYKYIYATDIEYWKIKSTLQAHAFYKGNNQSQQAINEQESTNQNFETQSNQYHQVESTFQSNFNTSFEAINPADTTTQLTRFANATRWFTDQLVLLYDASGDMKILFTLPLLLGLTMFFLGRGGKVMEQAENRYSSSDIQKMRIYDEWRRKQ